MADYYAGDLAENIWLLQVHELSLSRRLKHSQRPESSAARYGKTRAVTERELELAKARRLEMLDELRERLAGHPVMPFLLGVPGIGLGLAPLLIGFVEGAGGFLSFKHRSSLARFAGLGVDAEGRAERPRKPRSGETGTKGEPLVWEAVSAGEPWNWETAKAGEPLVGEAREGGAKIIGHRPMKALLMGRIGTQWIMCKDGLYYELFAARKQEYLERGWRRGRAHLGGLRVACKMLLYHCWEEARRMEGLPVEPPYPHAVLGHTSEPIGARSDHGSPLWQRSGRPGTQWPRERES